MWKPIKPALVLLSIALNVAFAGVWLTHTAVARVKSPFPAKRPRTLLFASAGLVMAPQPPIRPPGKGADEEPQEGNSIAPVWNAAPPSLARRVLAKALFAPPGEI